MWPLFICILCLMYAEEMSVQKNCRARPIRLSIQLCGMTGKIVKHQFSGPTFCSFLELRKYLNMGSYVFCCAKSCNECIDRCIIWIQNSFVIAYKYKLQTHCVSARVLRFTFQLGTYSINTTSK